MNGIVFTSDNVDNDGKIYHTSCRVCRELEVIKERMCSKCTKSSNDTIFGTYTVNEIEYYDKYCEECKKYVNYVNFITTNEVPEKICEHCKCSSLTNIFKYINYGTITLDTYCEKCEPNVAKIICEGCNC